MLLPHSTAAELYMTANIREWRHIFQLRADKHAHPSVQQMMIPLLLHFKSKMPELFNDIGYNEDFNQQDYAEIKLI
jgi:thymidylate synthase (FAD)